MTYDIFYLGNKPNAHINEQFATSIEDAREKSTTQNFWIIDEYNIYDNNFWSYQFDENNNQDVINKQFINIWPNHLSKNSGVSLLPKKSTDIIVYRGDVVPLKSLIGMYDCFLIDHHNEEFDSVKNTLQSKLVKNKVTPIKYWKSYLNTLRRICELIPDNEDRLIWICSSICNYTDFQFNITIDPGEYGHIYTYPSLGQKFGDTFLLHTRMLKSQIFKVDKLENFVYINFRPETVQRIKPPIFTHNDDTQLYSVKNTFSFPYAIFESSEISSTVEDTYINLWSEETQNITVTHKGSSRLILPRIATFYINKQLYDYPRIFYNEELGETKPLDIIFLSNGENCADKHYAHLLEVTKKHNNKVIRVDNVNGRVNAYHAAAKNSSTTWYFTVFAKLLVNENFDWSWQPDRLQDRKHYIFYAHNPVNDLNYGHQAMIAYNKKLVLNNNGIGLDFTLDDNHEVVEINSGTAFYNIDEFTTWRTAFREAIKLKHDNSLVSKNRLEQWKTVGKLQYGEFSILGATDACNYYEQVCGDIHKLKLSYDWPWLKELFTKLYNK